MYLEPDLWSEEFRGCGRTTDQLLRAPEGAVFVAVGPLGYTERLAKSLGRADIKVASLSWVASERYRGMRTALLVDHFIHRHMTDREREWLGRAFAYVRARGPH